MPVIVDGRPWGRSSRSSRPSRRLRRGRREHAALGGAPALGRPARGGLRERLERAQLGTAEALKAALDAKAAATAERPRRSCSAARRSAALGWDRTPSLSALRYAATLHDIGELGVPEAILNKPGPLTDEERPAIERHPLIGEGILSPVEFLADVAAAGARRPRALGRHRLPGRPGGRGDPARRAHPVRLRLLRRDDHRAALPRRRWGPAEEAEELRRVAGTQLDPRVVEALLGVLDAGS